MKRLIALLLSISVASLAVATEVIVTGYGSSYEAALKDAKTQATERVVGTWLNSEQSYDNGKYDEVMVQYNGGVITKYEVLSRDINSVTIKAQVEKNKTNIVVGHSIEISSELRDKLSLVSEKNNQIANAVQYLNDKNKAFAVTVNKIDYANLGNRTQVTLYVTFGWNPKWISDIESLAMTIDQKTSSTSNARSSAGAVGVTSAIGVFGPIGAIAGSILYSPVAGPKPKTRPEPAICFGSTRTWSTSDCYIINSAMTNFTSSTRFEIQGMSNKSKVLISNGNIDNLKLYENLYSGQKKRDIIGLNDSYDNPTMILYKEETHSLKVQFDAPTQQLATVDKFNFIFK